MVQKKFVRASAPASQPGVSAAAFDGKEVFTGRSGVIRAASVKVRGRPATWRTMRKHGPVIVIDPASYKG